MSNSMMLLVNPAAGRTTTPAAIGAVVEAFCKSGWHPTVFYTTGPKSAGLLAKQNGADFDILVCLGGDGTLSDVIYGIMSLPEDIRPKLGYIPMGTANDVAHTLNLPQRKPAQAAKDIINGQQMPYDIGKLDQNGFFSYVAAFGAFTEVSYKTDQEMKNLLGHAAYVLNGLQQLPKVKSYKVHVEYDGGEFDDELVFGAVSNSTSVAGMVKLDKRVVALSDGKFEMVLVRKPETISDVNAIITGIINQNYDGNIMRIIQTSHVVFTFNEPVPWTRDGEDGGSHQRVEITNLHKAVDFIL